jgi:hypothetical protein
MQPDNWLGQAGVLRIKMALKQGAWRSLKAKLNNPLAP